MARGYATSLLLLVLGLGLLAAGASRIPGINRLRAQYELESVNPFEDNDIKSELRLPTVALFTFRSLAIDYLWIRADNLKQQGQYFDALHLARMICALQPNLASVWDFQAWNMAYNISVAMPNGPERWNWVRAGYELLRDQGLAANPRSPKIYHSLSWIFQHKIGGISDDRHRYYKLCMAYAMMPILGNGTNEELQAMAEAETDWKQLQADPKITKLLKKIRQAEPEFDNDRELWDGLLDIRISPTKYSPALHQVIADNQRSESFRKLNLFVRTRALRHDWKMDPAKMLEINERYGPVDYESEQPDKRLSLDWRLPYSHAIYWATQGLQYANAQEFVYLSLQRVVYQSLQDLFHYGHLEIFPGPPPQSASARQEGQEIIESIEQAQMRLFVSRDMRMFPVAYQATLDIIDAYQMKNVGRDPGGIVDGSVNLCRSGIVNFQLTGYTKMARKYYNHLRDRYPENEDYQQSLEDFVGDYLRKEFADISPKNAADYIDAFLRNGYGAYAIHNDNLAALYQKYAQQVHSHIGREYAYDVADRLTLPPLSGMKQKALINFLSDPSVNPYRKGMLVRRIEIDFPDEYQWLKKQIEQPREDSHDPAIVP